MKTIFVYGDSNTWGQKADRTRYDHELCWTSKLQQKLGEGYFVYSAGLSGRIAGSYDNVTPTMRGKDSFEVVYRQAFPVDVVIIALGTNDIKNKYAIAVDNIASDLLWYVKKLEEMQAYDGSELNPRMLFLLPPKFDKQKFGGDDDKRIAVIQEMQDSDYQTVVPNGVDLDTDGVHFSANGHEAVAHNVYEKLKEMGI